EAIRSQFDHYQTLHKEFERAQTRTGAEANQAWEDYLDSLERRPPYRGRWLIKNPSSDGHLPPRKAVPATRKAVQDSGIPVPNNWNTGDRATFVSLARREATKKIQQAFQKRLDGLPQGLGLTGFSSHASVQKRWKAELGYPDSASALAIGKI